jgi:hypothetical protein
MVFGAPYVEYALAMVLGAGLLGFRAMGIRTSVAILIRLEYVLKTLHSRNGR